MITPIKSTSPSQNTALRAMFFGRYDCDYSERAKQHLAYLGFEVHSTLSKDRREILPHEIDSWSGQFIFCFRSYFRLPERLLRRATVAAINFHPGPPEYPGSGCANWALYEDSPTYGATAHLMSETIDSGPIVECRRFPVLPQDTVESLLSRTHLKTFDLLLDITTGLALEGRAFLDRKLAESASERWNGKARRMYQLEELQRVNESISKKELERIIRATYTPDFSPEIRLHGYRFLLKL